MTTSGGRERLVVIGGDAAGMSAASQARRREPAPATTALGPLPSARPAPETSPGEPGRD